MTPVHVRGDDGRQAAGFREGAKPSPAQAHCPGGCRLHLPIASGRQLVGGTHARCLAQNCFPEASEASRQHQRPYDPLPFRALPPGQRPLTKSGLLTAILDGAF